MLVSVQVLVLMPMYLLFVGPRLYGGWLGAGDFLIWMQAFDLGLPNLMIQRIGAAHAKGDRQAVAEYYATGLAVAAFVSIAIAFGFSVVAWWIPGWMGISGGDASLLRHCFILGAMATSINLFNNTVIGFSRAIQDTEFLNASVVVATAVGFCSSLFALGAGWGLWAIPLGLMARALVAISASAIFNARVVRGEVLHHMRVRRAILEEFFEISPATALGGLGYALMNQSEAAIVAIVLRPELTTILAMSRKLLEVGRSIVDMIAFASYGGIAHLAGSQQRHRMLQIHSEITRLRMTCAIIGAAAFMAVNPSFIGVWVGSAQYGGNVLTVLLAIQFIVAGHSFLLNYLYRAMGAVMKGSLALVAESVVRLPAMALFAFLFHLAGVPVAAIVTSAFFVVLLHRWTLKEVGESAEKPAPTPLAVLAVRGALLATGVLICVKVNIPSWRFVAVTGTAMVAVGGGLLLVVDRQLRATIAPFTRVFSRAS